MHQALTQKVDSMIEMGWVPRTMTETTASLVGRRPISWWLFLFAIVFFPLFGGVLYLVFWLTTSRTTVFLHQEGDDVIATGDLWLVSAQEQNREAYIRQQQQIKERGFLTVMWPHLLAFLVFLAIWVVVLQWYF
jgi:hypothetical protein